MMDQTKNISKPLRRVEKVTNSTIDSTHMEEI